MLFGPSTAMGRHVFSVITSCAAHTAWRGLWWVEGWGFGVGFGFRFKVWVWVLGFAFGVLVWG